MKRTFKKAFAALTATAIAASSFAVTSFAAPIATDITTGDNTIYSSDDINLYTVGTNNPTDVTSVILNLTLTDDNYGWGNAVIWANSGTAGWKQVSASSVNNEDTTHDYKLEVGVAQDIELELATDYWFQVGINEYGDGVWQFNSITFMSGEDVYYSYTAPEPETTPAAYSGSLDIETTDNDSWWHSSSITIDALLGDVNPTDVEKIVFYSNDNIVIGYNGTTVDEEGNAWTQVNAAKRHDLTDIDLGDNFYMELIANVNVVGTTTINWDVYTKVEEETSAYEASADIEATGSYWDVTTISKTDLIGDIDPATIEKIVFESSNNFAIGYNSVDVQSVNEETGEESYWVTADTGNSYEITDMDLSVDAEYFSMQLIGRVETGTTTITWKVYTKPALVESLNGTSVTLGDTIGVNLYLDLGEELIADEEAVVEYFFADDSCYNNLVSDGEETENGYKFTVEVDAKEMTDEFTAQVVAGDGRRGELYTVSVKEYADQIINAEEGTYSDETIALVKAMLVYGGYAQEYFDYNTDNLASAGLDTDVSSARITSTYETYVDGTLPEGMSFYGTSLILEGTTTLRLYFTATAELAEAYGLIANGDYYCYDITSIYVSDLDEEYTASFGDCTIYCSALSYAYRAINSSTNEELINLVKALRLYNVAANNYVAA